MIPLVYVASPAYSGSTLVALLLNAHPALATVGELTWRRIDLETYACSCGRLLRDCSFFQRVREGVQARGLSCDLKWPATAYRCPAGAWSDRVLRARVRSRPFEAVRTAALHLLPDCRGVLAITPAVNRAMIEVVLEIQGGQQFVDISKEPVRLKYFLDSGQYDVRLIQLVRDGRGVVNSAIKNEGLGAAGAARDWVRTHREIERLARRLEPDRFFVVRYEDLCSDPPAATRRIFAFLRVPPVDVTRDFHTQEHHIIGNRMRLKTSNRIELDEKWRSMLSPAALRAFERVGGAMNHKYGYDEFVRGPTALPADGSALA